MSRHTQEFKDEAVALYNTGRAGGNSPQTQKTCHHISGSKSWRMYLHNLSNIVSRIDNFFVEGLRNSLMVALNNTDVNKFVRANNRTTYGTTRLKQHITATENDKQPVSTTERVYMNELPCGAKVISKINQQQKSHFTEGEIAQIIEKYTKDRLTVYQLGEKYGCDRSTISKVLKRNGVTPTRERLDGISREKAIELYNTGQSLKQVGQQLDVSPDTIRRMLLNNDVAIRQPHRYTKGERKQVNGQLAKTP